MRRVIFYLKFLTDSSTEQDISNPYTSAAFGILDLTVGGVETVN